MRLARDYDSKFVCRLGAPSRVTASSIAALVGVVRARGSEEPFKIRASTIARSTSRDGASVSVDGDLDFEIFPRQVF
jgi:hypothetical protein